MLKSKRIKSTDDLTREFPDRFTGIGKFAGEYRIRLCPDTHPVIHTPRKCPIALCPKVKEHLAKMEALGVITHIDQPTDWVLSITYIQKANGELCLCLVPHDLNRAICHDHHKMPTVEEVAHEFANLHYFTKLDACHGYWSIVLDEESSLLMTFNSPFGRYHFLCLPFGLVCSQDIFQKKMDQFLKECPGCIGIADDITITWSHWGRTWCASGQPYAGSPQVWSCVQSTENTCEGPSHKLLWLPIWCQWCTSGSREGWCCACSPSTHKCHWAPGVPWYGDIPQPLHLWPVHPNCSSARTPEKRCWLHLECQLWNHFWVDQGSCHQWYHPQVLRPITTHDNPKLMPHR